MCSSDIFLGVIAILFPPIAVWIKRSLCSADSLINLALCMLGYLPGLLHAWYIIAKYPEQRYEYEAIPSESMPPPHHHQQQQQAGTTPTTRGGGGARGEGVTYYYVAQQQRGGEQAGRKQGAERGYGTSEGMRVGGHGEGGVGGVGAGGSESQGQGQAEDGGVPPSYDQAVRGDHKVQT